MGWITVDGVRLEFMQIAGPPNRAPIVFLHEGLGSVSQWTQHGLNWPQAVCEATGRAGVVYSRRGYGQSAPVGHGRNVLPADYMHRQAWDVLPQLLAQLHIYAPVLLGHSDGATIALLHASRLPVAACIALAPHVWVEPIAVQAITQAVQAFASTEPLPNLRARLAKHHADVDGAFWQWADVWLSSAFSTFDIRADCAHITAPLLLVQGLDDAYGTLRQLDDIARQAPHAQQLRLADCGHAPQRDQSATTLQAITAFLASAD